MNIAIILVGAVTSILFVPSTTYDEVPEPEPVPFVEIEATVTAYTSSIDETDSNPFETAAGTETRHGIVACPSHLPFGTEVIIETTSYVCEDRMNKRYRNTNRFDIWMETKNEAVQWGKKELTVLISEAHKGI